METSENLRRIENELAGLLANKALEKALAGSEKMIEFALPALSDRFDSGIRRQQVANAGSLASILLQKTLGAENPGQPQDNVIDVTPTDSLPGTGILNDFAKLLGNGGDVLEVGQANVHSCPTIDEVSDPTLPPPPTKKSE